jgi:hypothetical protein
MGRDLAMFESEESIIPSIRRLKQPALETRTTTTTRLAIFNNGKASGFFILTCGIQKRLVDRCRGRGDDRSGARLGEPGVFRWLSTGLSWFCPTVASLSLTLLESLGRLSFPLGASV